jgi:hypothetical protein
VITLVIVGITHFIAEVIWPGLRDIYQPPVLAPFLLAVGAWVGYKTIQFGGTYINAIVAGALLGLLPIVVQLFGFGMLLGRGIPYGILASEFGFAYILYGSLIGGGFALTK